MKNGILVVTVAMLAMGPALTTAGDAPGSKDRGQHWAAVDADGDGALSPAEAQAGAPWIAENFATLDADQDGRITRLEMHEHRSATREARRARGEERFRQADANGDGSIDLAEAQAGMPRAAERFAEIDADGNGQLTHEELRAGMHGRHGGPAHHGGDRQGPSAPPGE